MVKLERVFAKGLGFDSLGRKIMKKGLNPQNYKDKFVVLKCPFCETSFANLQRSAYRMRKKHIEGEHREGAKVI